MPRRRGILVGCERQLEFDTTHRAAVADVDPTHLATRRRWWERTRHTAQHAESDLPDEPNEGESDRRPDDRAEHGALVEVLETLDDECVGQAATFTHRLQAVTTTRALEFVQQCAGETRT